MGLNLVGKIELDGAGFERGLHRAGDQVADLAKHAAIAAFGFYGVEESIKKTVETATELVNTSKRLDVTVEQLQLLRQAAKDGGTEMDTLASAFEKLDIARAKAFAGDKGAIAAFNRLGITQDQLQKQTAASLFTGSISNAAKNNSVEDIGPALKEILGKGFGALIPTLKTDFDELSGKMKKLGSIMDTETAVKLKAVGDEFDLLKNIMATQLGPVLLTVIESLIVLIGKLHSTGVGLEELLNSKDGPVKGLASFGKMVVDSVINKIPGALGEKLQDASDGYYQSIFGLSPKDALNNVLGAGQAFSDDDQEQQDKIEAFRQRLREEADALNNPTPRRGDEAPTTPEKKLHNIPADALVKVGNFLGSNGNTIERVNQQKIQLLQRIADSNDKIFMNIQRNGIGGIPGLGVPTV